MSQHAPSRANEPQDPRRAMLLLGAFGVAWAVLESVVGAQVKGDYHLIQVVWCRYAVHLATLALLFGWRRPERLWRTRRPVYQLTRSMLMLVMPVSFAMSVGRGTPPNTVWSVFWLSTPLLVIGIAYLLLGERARWPIWVSAALGAVAAFVMLAPSRPSSPLLLILPGLMALSFSAYVVMTRSLADEPVLANLTYTALGVFLALTPFMPRVWVMPSIHDTVALIGIGVVGLVALLALDRSAALAPVSASASVLYVYLVSLAAIGVLRYGDRLSLRSLAGVALIVVITGFQWSQESSSPDRRRGQPAALSEDVAQ